MNEPNLDEKLQIRQHVFSDRQFSLELVQKITFFVISVELIGCGYILLQAANLTEVKHLNYLFLLCGLSALLGLLWRFCYNNSHFNSTHGYQFSAFLNRIQSWLHNLYVVASIVTFVWFLYLGFNYLTWLSTAM
ncbi:MAG: hypothetical protein ABL880_07745 [Methylotenera sp.]